MRVFAYRNLHRKGVVWSLKDCTTNLVIDRTSVVFLADVELKVSEAGRQRVLRTQQKNVHAGVKGTRLDKLPEGIEWRSVTYNPYSYSTFVDLNGEPILSARFAKLTEQGLFVSN